MRSSNRWYHHQLKFDELASSSGTAKSLDGTKTAHLALNFFVFFWKSSHCQLRHDEPWEWGCRARVWKQQNPWFCEMDVLNQIGTMMVSRGTIDTSQRKERCHQNDLVRRCEAIVGGRRNWTAANTTLWIWVETCGWFLLQYSKSADRISATYALPQMVKNKSLIMDDVKRDNRIAISWY